MKHVPDSKRHRAALEYTGLALACLAGGVLAGAASADPFTRLVLVALGLIGCAFNGADSMRLLAASRARR